MDKALIEVFDSLTKYTHENRYELEGWKTNDTYLMNEKFIMPYMCREDRWNTGSNKVNIQHRTEVLDDLTKAICYLTGTDYSAIPTLYSHCDKIKAEYGQLFDYCFFEVRCYKKGTAHFKFKDRDVWAMLNQHVARIKGYPLPESIKRKNKAA